MTIQFTKANGKKIFRNDCIKAQFKSNKDTHIFSARFLFANTYYDYKFIDVIYDSKVIFKGIVTTQTFTENGKEKYLDIECHSLVGLLTDNYLRPQNINRLTDEIIYKKFLEPNNIDIHTITNKPCMSLINTGNSMSVWELIKEYSKRVFNCTPFINAVGTAFLGEFKNTTVYKFSDSDRTGFIHIGSIKRTYNRKGIVSRVHIRRRFDNNGYGLVLENTNALERGINCERYIDAVPPSKGCILDGINLLKDTEINSVKFILECDCFLENAVGSTAEILLSNGSYKNLEIKSIKTKFDKNGVKSVVELYRKEVSIL